jgi:hypothetical protein
MAWNNKGTVLNILHGMTKQLKHVTRQFIWPLITQIPGIIKEMHLHTLKNMKSIGAFNKAIQIDPQYADAWNNKGFALNFLEGMMKHSEHLTWQSNRIGVQGL